LIVSGAVGDWRMPQRQRIRGKDGCCRAGVALSREDVEDHVGRVDALGHRLFHMVSRLYNFFIFGAD